MSDSTFTLELKTNVILNGMEQFATMTDAQTTSKREPGLVSVLMEIMTKQGTGLLC